MPRLKISCQTGFEVDFRNLRDFQGDLKPLSKSNYKRLRAQLEAQGYSFSAQIWRDSEGILWILDGHQRLRVIRSMAEDGWEIPPLPVTMVEAESLEQATTKLMAAVSQFGIPTEESLYEFMNTRNLDIDFIIQANRIPDVDIYSFKAAYFDEPKPKPEKEEEPEICDHCGAKKRRPRKKSKGA